MNKRVLIVSLVVIATFLGLVYLKKINQASKPLLNKKERDKIYQSIKYLDYDSLNAEEKQKFIKDWAAVLKSDPDYRSKDSITLKMRKDFFNNRSKDTIDKEKDGHSIYSKAPQNINNLREMLHITNLIDNRYPEYAKVDKAIKQAIRLEIAGIKYDPERFKKRKEEFNAVKVKHVKLIESLRKDSLFLKIQALQSNFGNEIFGEVIKKQLSEKADSSSIHQRAGEMVSEGRMNMLKNPVKSIQYVKENNRLRKQLLSKYPQLRDMDEKERKLIFKAASPNRSEHKKLVSKG